MREGEEGSHSICYSYQNCMHINGKSAESATNLGETEKLRILVTLDENSQIKRVDQ